MFIMMQYVSEPLPFNLTFRAYLCITSISFIYLFILKLLNFKDSEVSWFNLWMTHYNRKKHTQVSPYQLIKKTVWHVLNRKQWLLAVGRERG